MKNIVLDMGNVLVGWQPAAFALRAAGNAEDAKLLSAALFERKEWALGDAGLVSREEMQRLACEGLPARLHGAMRALEENWPYWMPDIEGAGAFVKRARAAGFSVYLLSNASERFPEALRDRDFFSYFNGMLFSAHEKMVKPDPAIYRLLCSRFHLKAEECFFLDDLEANVAGAKSIGMQAMVFEGDYRQTEEALNRLGIFLAE